MNSRISSGLAAGSAPGTRPQTEQEPPRRLPAPAPAPPAATGTRNHCTPLISAERTWATQRSAGCAGPSSPSTLSQQMGPDPAPAAGRRRPARARWASAVPAPRASKGCRRRPAKSTRPNAVGADERRRQAGRSASPGCSWCGHHTTRCQQPPRRPRSIRADEGLGAEHRPLAQLPWAAAAHRRRPRGSPGTCAVRQHRRKGLAGGGERRIPAPAGSRCSGGRVRQMK